MTTHCAVTCPVVSEAVKAATPESRIAMALAAIESEKISERAAAERFDVPQKTLNRYRQKTATEPSDSVAAPAAKATKGKDGKDRKPPVTPDELARAWDMKDSGMSPAAIAQDLGRGERTVRNWFAKERPQALERPQVNRQSASPDQPVSEPPSEAVLTPEPEAPIQPAPAEHDSAPPVATAAPDVVKPVNKRPAVSPDNRKNHYSQYRWVESRWLPAAQKLLEARVLLRAECDRLGNAWRHRDVGGKVFTIPYQRLAAEWAEKGYLSDLAELLGCENESVDSVLLRIQDTAEACAGIADGLRMFTGCRKDNNMHD